MNKQTLSEGSVLDKESNVRCWKLGRFVALTTRANIHAPNPCENIALNLSKRGGAWGCMLPLVSGRPTSTSTKGGNVTHA